ncbi:MAG: TonB-dependent receptor [Arenicellales bacterium]|nr:TonB-dependent receptor [Arenicellales bacterium]
MKNFSISGILAVVVIPFLTVLSVQAADPVIVTATRTAQTADEVLAPVTVISREDIETSAARDLGELLSSQVGLEIARNGGYGKNTSVFMRGTNAGHVLTLVDGIKLFSATVGATAFQFLPLDQIERIEIVRGPRSSLYGSEALGGVIQIFTRKGGDSREVHAEAGYGTYDTAIVGAGIAGPAGDSRFSVQVDVIDTDGIDSTVGAQSDKDGYDNTSLSARWSGSTSDGVGELDLSLLYASGNTGFDNPWAGPLVVNDSSYAQQVLNLKWHTDGNGGWSNTIQVGQSRDDSKTFADNISDGEFNTTHNQASWQLDWPVAEVHLLTGGIDYADDSVDGSVSYDVSSRSNLGLFGQWQGGSGSQSAVAGLRFDDNGQFGNHFTGNLDYGLSAESGLRFNAGLGTAFKAPSFNDLYYPGFGNPTLEVESSTSYEVGVSGDAGSGSWALRLFNTDIEDLVAYDALTYAPVNLDHAVIDGLELDWSGKLSGWQAAAGIALMNPKDKATGLQLARRPKQSGQVRVDRRSGDWRYGFSTAYHGKRYDDKANTVALESYTLIDGGITYSLGKRWQFRIEANNLLDESYQTAAGFREPGRNFLARVIIRD